MPIELKMPALSPTMEEGTLAKWLVKEGDEVKSGDILAEIETDKATMEFEAVDEGTVAKILVPEGTDGVKVGAPIAILAGEGEDASTAAGAAPKADTPPPAPPKASPPPKADATPKAPPSQAPVETPAAPPQPASSPRADGDRVKASPLAR
ncbi:biotin/lipoyl-containing protein, partial [Sphingomonas segetis]|uniref:biotin/lipoyl-containing protein n=1 Tax=Sphingomonas segetis TaxID=1104779 RepID=UPI0012D31489